jgi:glycosyltransferase involved in cell wall biosynthesis
MNNPILSICIPTYNRASYLEATLHSIVSQKTFQKTDHVEIIIADNCSEDNTREVSEKYVEIYSNKIRYYRNSENLGDTNFEKVLSYGKGVFLKLNNDTLIHQEDTLDIIIDLISQNNAERNIIFFSNGSLKKITKCHCVNLDIFVKTVSYFSTWIGSFGIWKNDFDSFDGFSRNACLQLVQTDILFGLINKGKSVLVYNLKIFDSIIPKNKGGYDIITIFLQNYFFLLTQQVNAKNLSPKIFKLEKRKVLINRVAYAIFLCKVYPLQYSFTFENMYKRIYQYYKNDLTTFSYFLIYYNFLIGYSIIKSKLIKKG